MRQGITLLVAAAIALAAQLAPEANAAAVDKATEAEIAAQARAYENAIVRKDAAAIAALWMPDGTITDAGGYVTTGRANIEQRYTRLFSEYPTVKVQVDQKHMDLREPGVLVEHGISILRDAQNNVVSRAPYVAVHRLVNGRWLISQENNGWKVPIGHALGELSWLQGKWRLEGANKPSIVMNNRMLGTPFMATSFEEDDDPKTADLMITTQDAKTGQLVATIFDANGARGKALWHRMPNGTWTLRSVRHTTNGTFVAGTHLLTPVNAKSFRWKTVARTVNGKRLADSAEVTAVLESGAI